MTSSTSDPVPSRAPNQQVSGSVPSGLHLNPVSGIQSFLAGGIAGTVVDISLFPLDTIKTRLQSKQGFYASGGFSRIYSGLTSAAVGSAPGAALFFMTFEKLKTPISHFTGRDISSPVVHLSAAAFGEMVACIVRVPTDLIKQRLQTKLQPSVTSAARDIYLKEGILGFYRGYAMTIFREIPFSAIQFPLYQHLKTQVRIYSKKEINAIEAAMCGSIAGGVAAALTTPLDVVKTRIMLSNKLGHQLGVYSMFRSIIVKEGPAVLLSGIVPRVTWISIGGAVFLGTYETALSIMRQSDC